LKAFFYFFSEQSLIANLPEVVKNRKREVNASLEVKIKFTIFINVIYCFGGRVDSQ